jgi:hypothetical protein
MSRLILSARPGDDPTPGAVADAVLNELQVDGVVVAHVEGRASTPLLTRGGLAPDVERLHFELGEGPGFDAMRVGPVAAPDVCDDLRWAAFALAAAHAGLGAVWAYPLTVAGAGAVGWIGLARRRPGALVGRDADEAALVAPVLGQLAVRGWTRGEGRTVDEELGDLDRDVVHTAVGVVAERRGVDVDEAAWRLRAQAWTEGRELTELAVEVVGLDRRPVW